MDIELNDESTWPEFVQGALERSLPMLRAYETKQRELAKRLARDVEARWDREPDPHHADREHLIAAIMENLRDKSVVGYHCTRLHDDEIVDIKTAGMRPLDPDLVQARVMARVRAGDLPSALGDSLIAKSRAGDANRRGMIHFVLTTAPLRKESAVLRFFRSWGGEAIYLAHENEAAVHLRAIGTPCVVEVAVPIDGLVQPLRVTHVMVARYLRRHRISTDGELEAQGRTAKPLPASAIRAVIRLNEKRFETLTRMRSWREDVR